MNIVKSLLGWLTGKQFIMYMDSGGGGGGGGGNQTSTSTQTAELPEWARGYAKDTLAKGAALTDINQNPYQTYGANRIAGFSPMQQQSFQGAANMQPSQQLGTGTDLATAAGLGALNTQYQSGQFDNQFQAPGQYQPGQFSMMQAQAPDLQNFQMGPAERVRTQSFANPYSAQQYMSPYMQNVVDIQQREAQRQADIAGTGRNAQAVGAGAFGGSRQAIMDAEAARNLATQKGDIQAQGLQNAFGQAQGQFNTEQQARLQAQMANQQAGINVGGQNLNALLGVQQLGAGQDLQSQLANQQTFQQAQNAAEQSRQYGAGQGLQAAGLGAQYGQAANQLGEQSRQYGAGLGMQGLQTGLQAAGQLGQLGGQQFQQGMDINKLQSTYGGQMQQQAQRPLDQAYQDFLNQQNYPYKQLGFMSDMIRGLPLGQQSTQTMYQPAGSFAGQLGGLGMGALGLSSLFGSGKAEGGSVKSYAGGGEINNPSNVQNIIGKLSDAQLKQAYQVALAERDAEKANLIKQEEAQRSSMRQGISSAITPQFADNMEQGMATGGIVAFAGDDGSVVNEGENYSLEGMRTPTPAPKAKASSAKPSPVVQSAVAQLAQQTGQDPTDLMAQTKQISDMFKQQYQPMLEQMKSDVDASKPDNEAIRQQGIGQALAQFGFKMAANAARPGARFLESASAAAPELADVAAKTQDLMATRQKNYQDLKSKQMQYEVALNNGNMKDATLLAGQIRQQQQADKTLAFHIANAQDTLAIEKQKLGIMESTAAKQREPEALQELQYAKQHPEDQALLEKILGQVHTGIGAAGIRAGTAENASLDKALKDIASQQKYQVLGFMKPDNPKYGALKAEYDAEVRAAYARHGGGGTSGSPPPTEQPSMASKGFKVLGTE